jgi:hypothetical protein
VGAEVLVDPRVGPFGEEMQIDVAEIAHGHRW